jgi:cystatin-A/B
MDTKHLAGGWSEEKAVTPEVQCIVDKIKTQIEGRINMRLTVNKGISYVEQIVSGKNYRIFLEAAQDIYLAVQVYVPLGNSEPQLTEIFQNSLTMRDNAPHGATGAWSEIRFPTAEIQRLVDEVRPQVEAKKNRKFCSFGTMEWISQVVYGFNYRARINTGEDVPLVIDFYLSPFPIGATPELKDIVSNSLTVDQKRLLQGAPFISGGWSEQHIATPEIQKIADKVKPQIEAKINLKLSCNKALLFISQVVSGINYRILIEANPTTLLAYQVYIKATDPENPQVTEIFDNSLTMSENSHRVGGWSAEKVADKRIEQLTAQVRPQVEAKGNKKYPVFESTHYIEQLVAGTNYRVRVRVGEKTFIAIQFFVGLGPDAKPELTHVFVNNLLLDEHSEVSSTRTLLGARVGGWSAEKAPTEEIRAIAKKLKDQIGERRHIKMNFNDVLSYCEQVVDGKNYRILIQANEGDFVAYQAHVRAGSSDPELVEIFENSLTLTKNDHRMGGWSEEKDGNEQMQKLVEEVRPQVEAREGKTFKFFTILNYISAVAAGTKYRIRVKTGGDVPLVFDCFVGLDGAQVQLLDVIPNSLTVDKNRPLLGGASSEELFIITWSAEKAATYQVQNLIEQLKPEVEAKTNKKFTTYKGITFITQLVNGMNYRVLIQIQDMKFVVIQFYMRFGFGVRPELTEVFENTLTLSDNSHLPGSWSEEKEADENVKRLVITARAQVEAKTNANYPMFNALQYISQVVRGTNYRVRVQVGKEQFLVIQFWVAPSGFLYPNVQEVFTNSLTLDDQSSSHETLATSTKSVGSRVVGGWSRELVATPQIQKLTQQVKTQVEAQTDRKYPTFTALQYSYQVVEGMNYRIRVKTGELSFMVIQVYLGLGVHAEPKLTAILEDASSLAHNIGFGVGGWSVPKFATAEIQELAEDVRAQVEKKTSKNYPTYEAVQFTEQIVAGMNYRISVRVGESRFIVIQIFVGLGVHAKPELTQVWENYASLGEKTNAGGYSPIRDATEDIQKLITEVKDDVEKKTNKKFTSFKALNYRQQVVAGMNYLVYCQADKDLFMTVAIFVSLDVHEKPEVTNVWYAHGLQEIPN